MDICIIKSSLKIVFNISILIKKTEKLLLKWNTPWEEGTVVLETVIKQGKTAIKNDQHCATFDVKGKKRSERGTNQSFSHLNSFAVHFPEESLSVRDRHLLAVLSVQPVGVMAGRGIACKQRKKEYLQQCCGSGSVIQCYFHPWIRDPGWKKMTRDNHSGSYSESFVTIFWVKNTKNLCCGSGSWIRCLSDPGSGIRDGKVRIFLQHRKPDPPKLGSSDPQLNICTSSLPWTSRAQDFDNLLIHQKRLKLAVFYRQDSERIFGTYLLYIYINEYDNYVDEVVFWLEKNVLRIIFWSLYFYPFA
jgi:hypothetical protein